jgi:thioesterase domain-containing protein
MRTGRVELLQVTRDRPAGGRPVTLCLGTGLDDVARLRRLAEHYPTPGRLYAGQSSSEEPAALLAIDAAAADCADLVARRSSLDCLAGYCSAGLTAYAAAVRLREAAFPIGSLVLVETLHPESLARSSYCSSLYTMLMINPADAPRHPAFAERMAELERMRAEGAGGAALLAEIERAVSAHWEDVIDLRKERHVPLDGDAGRVHASRILGWVAQWLAAERFQPEPYAGDLTLVYAGRTQRDLGAEAALWRRTVSGNVEVVKVPGGHHDAIESPELVDVLLRRLAAA